MIARTRTCLPNFRHGHGASELGAARARPAFLWPKPETSAACFSNSRQPANRPELNLRSPVPSVRGRRHRYRSGLKSGLCKDHVNDKARRKTVNGRGLQISLRLIRDRQKWQDADDEANRPSAVAGYVNTCTRTGPLLT